MSRVRRSMERKLWIAVLAAGACGGGAAKPATKPTANPVAEPAPASAESTLKPEIRAAVLEHKRDIQYCYEKELLAKHELEGTTTVSFTIAPSGDVAEATGSGLDPAVDACIANVIKQVKFPPTGGGDVKVNYPFKFRAAGTPRD